MTLFGPKSLSEILHYITKTIGMVLLLLFAYVGISFLTHNHSVEGGRYAIPFFGSAIEGAYHVKTMLTVCLTLLFLAATALSLASIFNALRVSPIFTPRFVKSLQQFTVLMGILGPVLYLVVTFGIMQRGHFANAHNLILTLLFGAMGFFLTHICKKGMQVQQENDLTI
ncbi:hypothetical protein [Maribacter sp. 2307ULW6-5]|uniref:hypothetical protein n=1 Tax=Maribacter sp. 2307ULW6-5 TaxID=3386275 RepID=UPI0039BC5E1E